MTEKEISKQAKKPQKKVLNQAKRAKPTKIAL